MTLRYILLLLTIWAASVSADQPVCLDPEQAAIAGLVPGLPAQLVLDRRLTPGESVAGEDDGGGYRGRRYHQQSYEVLVVRNEIDEISTTSPDIEWYNGIRTGMVRQEVVRRLPLRPVATERDADHYAVCSLADDAYAVLQYRDSVLWRISLFQERP